VFKSCPSSQPDAEETHRASLALAEVETPENKISLAFFAYVKEFFPLATIDQWLQEVLCTITGSNTFMLRLINEEFPSTMGALSELLFVDRIRILDDKLCVDNDVKTIHITLPVRVDNLKHAGYPIIEKIVKYWLGDISIEVLEAGSTDSTTINRRIWGLRWDPFYYSWHIVAVKQRGRFVWHESEFSKDKGLKGIHELVHSAPVSHRQTIVPVIFQVGDTYVLKVQLCFKILGLVSVPPCTLWFNITIPTVGVLQLHLFDIAGIAGRAARLLFPTSMKLLMDTCSITMRLGDFEGVPEMLSTYSSLFAGSEKSDDAASKEGTGEECASSSSKGTSATRDLPSVFVCCHARCKARSVLTWIAHLIWTKLVESNAIFEIWKLVFTLFSALLTDVLQLAKKIPSSSRRIVAPPP